MYKRGIYFLIVAILYLLITPKSSHASTYISRDSAKLANEVFEKVADTRAKILREYLKSYDSPLAPYSETFISEADKYSLDWKLVASIAGLESTFGHHIPYNSYNAWGFGVYGDNVRRFTSWEDGIQTVSKSLRQDYLNKWKAKNVYEIGNIYAASPTWAQRVTFFMNQIDKFSNTKEATLLSISL